MRSMPLDRSRRCHRTNGADQDIADRREREDRPIGLAL